MDKINNVIISYWFEELSINPKEYITEIENELKSIFDEPFLYNNEPVHHLIGMPRIQAMSKNKNYLFQMSLINANFSINVSDLENDDVLLLINNYSQLFHDIIKNYFETRILYTSIKLEIIEEKDNSAKSLASKYINDSLSYEDFSIKKGFIKNNYYINYILSSSKEYNFDIRKDDNSLDQDIFDRTLITSLSCARLNKEFILKVVEINDRYIYNQDKNYESKKDSIRGMIIELKRIIENKLYDKGK